MTQNAMHPQVYDSFEREFLPLLSELCTESDRGVVLICAAFLDDVLASILQRRLQPIEGDHDRFGSLLAPEGILGAFGARIRLAYHTGAISASSYEALQKIRRVRNAFAHVRKGMRFDDPRVARLCESLNFIDRDSVATLRTHFVDTFVSLGLHLSYSISLTERIDGIQHREAYQFRNTLGEGILSKGDAKDGEAIPDNRSS